VVEAALLAVHVQLRGEICAFAPRTAALAVSRPDVPPAPGTFLELHPVPHGRPPWSDLRRRRGTRESQKDPPKQGRLTRNHPSTLRRPFCASASFMIGRTCWNLQISSSVGVRPVLLSGRGAISVVRSAYFVPAGSDTSFRKRRISRIGPPMRPGELNTYRSADGTSLGLIFRMR